MHYIQFHHLFKKNHNIVEEKSIRYTSSTIPQGNQVTAKDGRMCSAVQSRLDQSNPFEHPSICFMLFFHPARHRQSDGTFPAQFSPYAVGLSTQTLAQGSLKPGKSAQCCKHISVIVVLECNNNLGADVLSLSFPLESLIRRSRR